MMDLALRHLCRYWRLNLILLLCLTLASALPASLSGYMAAASKAELQHSLDGAGPDERSLLITGTPSTFGDALLTSLQQELGRAMGDRMVIRHATLPADVQPADEEVGPAPVVTDLEVYSFDRLAERVRLVAGRLPAPVTLGQAVGNWPPPTEAVLGVTAAGQSGYAPGNRLTASGLYHRLDIVGIVEPLDPHDDVWGGDLGAFIVAGGVEPGTGTIALPLIIDSQSMRSYLGRPIFAHQTAWRVTLDARRLDAARAEALRSGLVSFQAQATTWGARTQTGLVQILAEALARLSRLQVVFLLLMVQTLALVLYTQAMLGACVVEAYMAEVATLLARGLGPWRIAGRSALESLLLALLGATILGPGLAFLVLFLWSKGSGEALIGGLPGEMWLVSAIVAAAGWLTLAVPILLAAWRQNRESPSWRDRPPQQSGLHKRYVDLYLLAFGGLLVWQLNRSGSFLARVLVGSRPADGALADPLLLVGPFVLFVALALAFLRIVPGVLRLVARPFQSRRGLVLPLGLLRPARDPQQAGRAVLLIGLTVGLALFARVLRDSLARSPEVLQPELVHRLADVFQLNGLMLALFGVVVFFFVQLLAAQGRERDWGILRALGLSRRGWPALAIVEGSLVLVPGLLLGVGAGLGLAYMMIPHLTQLLLSPLADLPGSAAAVQVVVDWPALALYCAVLLALYGSALGLLRLILGRARPRQVPWPEAE